MKSETWTLKFDEDVVFVDKFRKAGNDVAWKATQIPANVSTGISFIHVAKMQRRFQFRFGLNRLLPYAQGYAASPSSPRECKSSCNSTYAWVQKYKFEHLVFSVGQRLRVALKHKRCRL